MSSIQKTTVWTKVLQVATNVSKKKEEEEEKSE